MADTITATLHYGEGGAWSISKTYSAKEYLDYVLNSSDTETYTETDRALMTAIKDYGHYAQLMLAEKHGHKLGEEGGYTEMDMGRAADFDDSAIGEVRTAVDSDNIEINNPEGSGVSDIAYSLNLDSSTAINLYFTVDGTASVSGKDIEDGDLEVSSEGGKYSVTIKNIPAHELDTKYELTISAAQTVTVKVSAMSYVRAVLNSEAENMDGVAIATMRNAAAAIYHYWNANMNYRDAHNYK